MSVLFVWRVYLKVGKFLSWILACLAWNPMLFICVCPVIAFADYLKMDCFLISLLCFRCLLPDDEITLQYLKRCDLLVHKNGRIAFVRSYTLNNVFYYSKLKRHFKQCICCLQNKFVWQEENRKNRKPRQNEVIFKIWNQVIKIKKINGFKTI